MIDGHGDDISKYSNIRLNFSSNIPSFVDLSALEDYLCSRMSVIRSYPEPSARTLEAKIAHSIRRSADEVVVTSGATEAIYLIAQTVSHLSSQEGKTYTVIHPTFSEYEAASRMFGMKTHPGSPLEGGDICWLCNPNNPTGEVYDEAYICQLANKHRWLVIDQSYEDYVLQDATCRVPTERRDGVISIHSMTKKYCIPGLRLGYVTASADVIARLRQFQRPWSVNALAIEAGLWLMEHQPCLVDMPAYLAEAQRLRTALDAIPGIHAHGTQTNFMLCTIEGHTAAELKEYLVLRHGILIRDASNFSGLSLHHFRVAAQRPEDNDELLNAIIKLRIKKEERRIKTKCTTR